ncbi:MAG TPA: trimeric intracellular cation channel family protein [Verrucomicrobiae bacterium]
MQYILEHFGVSIAAITGVLAARGKQVDLFGVIVLALVTAFGGGTIRDLALGDLPVFWATDSRFFLNAAITAVLLFCLVRFHEPPATVLLVADAFVLALFTMLGTRKGIAFATAPAIAIAMGVITGVAGGILRDLLLGEIPLVFRPHIYLYATAAFFGATVYVVLRHWSADDQLNMVLGTIAVLVLRLAGIRWRIGLPVIPPKNPAATP